MKTDWIALLEAATAPAPDDPSWANRLVEAAATVFGDGTFIGFGVIEHSADCRQFRVCTAAGTLPRVDAAVAVGSHVDRYGIRSLYYPPRMVMTATNGLTSSIGAEGFADLRRFYGIDEAHGLFAHPEPGVAAVLCVGYAKDPGPLGRYRTAALTRVALHLEAALRLRRRPESIKAVVMSDGRIVHLERGAPEPALLSRRVRAIERARTRRVRTTSEALDLWHALVDGRLSLVERTEGTRRHYLVVENPPTQQPMRALGRPELDAVSYAARGLSAKLVSYALGVSEPRISSRLASAASKIGLATRLELVRLAAMLTRDPRARFSTTALTTTEQDVLELLAQGLSNAEIAAMRNRSVRTIANQVAQLLRKTRATSRRDLVTRAIA